MTIVYNNNDQGPHTHALIIGVGAYPCLLGGDQERLLDNPMGLGQLTTSTVSARAFAGWVIHELHNQDAPLGSVELVLSESTSDSQFIDLSGQEVAIERATLLNIKQAFRRWYARCDTDRQNVALFYFCGHGLQSSETLALLPEDFGDDPLTLFDNSIDFNLTYQGMRSCSAQVQCYFIDACRQSDNEIRKRRRINARVLTDDVADDFAPETRDAPVVYAASLNEGAHGIPNQTTIFTELLLKIFRGLGSKYEDDAWVVRTEFFAPALRKIQQRLKLSPDFLSQHPVPTGPVRGSIIHVLKDPPILPVRVCVKPPEAAPFAHLLLEAEDNPVPPHRWCTREPQDGIWEPEVEADLYRVHAQFEVGEYSAREGLLWVNEPFAEARWR